MEADPLIVQAQTRLLKRADELVILADSRKFRQRSSMIVAPLERISTIVTDDGVKDEDLELFRSAGIKVIKVAVQVEDEAAAGDDSR
jgi:DeoR family ulaG and ulaABCDEF operon transcriptional repressor